MKKNIYPQASVSFVAIIIGFFVIGGASAAIIYVMNNQGVIGSEVDEVQEERAEQAQEDGYPSLWMAAGLPEYPNGELTKTREGNDLIDGVQVTIETSDSMETVTLFWDSEMTSRGFISAGFPGTEYATLVQYSTGTKIMSLQVTKIDDGPMNQIHIQYHE